ncbi:unnamed protein product [Brassicogethes aeneus]|uniref:PHD-type domain-containing protein n=1 Tax=Brassicogethes aeneus TaxID=1431903 RepID=A0A9P0AXR1_BRAAE|nr:unnamed protein product [Brassicogethes aeneus]
MAIMKTGKKTAKPKKLCLVCARVLNKTQLRIQCVECKEWVHETCTELAKKATTTKGKGANWSCPRCKEAPLNEEPQGDESESGSEPESGAEEESSNQSRKMNDLEQENKRLKKDIKELKVMQSQLQKQSEHNNHEINKTKQAKLEKNLIIVGMKKSDDNDYKKLVKRLGDVCNVKIGDGEIEYVQKLEKNDEKPIVKVALTSIEAKEKLLTAYKSKKGLKQEEIGQQGSDYIYINHDMTLENQSLFKKARSLKKEIDIKYVWFSQEEIHDEHKQKRRNSMGPKTLLERRWSQVSQVANFRKKKRNSLQPNILNEENEITLAKLPEEPIYMRVSKVEYEEIKNRVSKIERRISFELDHVGFQHRNINSIDNKKIEAVKNIEKVITAYEHTLEQNEPMSPTTDHLARRLSKELKIRRSSQEKIIRSPSARKIGSLRRRSKEIEKRQLKRHQSWHVTCQNNSKPHFNEFDDTPKQKNTVHRPVTRSTSFQYNVQTPTNSQNASLKSKNSTHWINANCFFSDTPNHTKINHNKNTPDNRRASIAKLRTQNAGMVLAKAKLFDNIQDSNLSASTKFKNHENVSTQSNKIGSRLSSESKRVKVLKLEESRVKKTSPRRRTANIARREDNIVITPINHTRYLNSPKCARGVPNIKKNLNIRSPKRLCRTPVNLDKKTPLKVLVSRINN